MARPPAPSDRAIAELTVQAVERVEALSMVRIYRMVFELCWVQPGVVIRVLDSLEGGEWKRTLRESAADATRAK
jgi:hypothetical protein